MDQMVYVLMAAVFSVGCAVSAHFFLRAYREENFKRGFWLKGAAALCFTAVGILLTLRGNISAFARLTVWGLFWGLCGDQLLALRFIFPKQHDLFFAVGAISFGVGHVFYVLALRSLGGLHWGILVLVFLAGAALSLLYAKKMGTDVGEKTPMAMGYVAVVLFMDAFAVSVAIASQSMAAALFALGGLLFCVSDNILCAYCFGKEPVWRMNRDLHIAYYAAQLAIAWSILLA